MAIFALISPADNAALEKAAVEKFKDRYFKVAAGQFMISAHNTTAQQLAQQLRISGGELGQVLILAVSNYFGCHNGDLWKWLDAVSKRPPDWIQNLSESATAAQRRNTASSD